MRRAFCAAALALALLASFQSEALAGTVEGRVTPVEWAQEIEVCAYGVELYERCAVPGPSGSYAYPGVEGPVAIEFIPTYRSRLLTQYWNHKASLKEATIISVGKGEVRTGIDADLTEGGAIQGTVTASAGGAGLAEVEVCAVSSSTPAVKSCAQTDSAGEYELHSLTTGHYAVNFSGHGSSSEFEPSSIASVVVTAGTATAGVNAALSEGGRIEGVVSAAGGSALDGVAVCLFAASDRAAERCTETSDGGAYLFEGLPPGDFQVGFDLADPEISGSGASAEVLGYVPQFYAGAATRAQANTISLLPSQRLEGVDAALSPLQVPLPAPPSTTVPNPVTPTALVVSQPTPKKTGCRKGYRKKKVKGKARCIKASKHVKPQKKRHRRRQIKR